MISSVISPTAIVLDEWEIEIEGITLVHRIKAHSGGDASIWYAADCWQRGVPSHGGVGRFDERPNRMQVEARLESAAAEIVRQANRINHLKTSSAHALLFKKTLEIQTDLPVAAPEIKLPDVYQSSPETGVKFQQHMPEVQMILRKSEWLKRRSDQVSENAVALSSRLALLHDRSRRICGF